MREGWLVGGGGGGEGGRGGGGGGGGSGGGVGGEGGMERGSAGGGCFPVGPWLRGGQRRPHKKDLLAPWNRRHPCERHLCKDLLQ